MAGVAAVAEVLVVATFCETVKLPVVLTEMVPVEFKPLLVTPAAVSDPMAKLPVLIKLSAPIDEAEAIVPMLFEVVLSVTLPAPRRTSPVAVMAAV